MKQQYCVCLTFSGSLEIYAAAAILIMAVFSACDVLDQLEDSNDNDFMWQHNIHNLVEKVQNISVAPGGFA